MFYVIFRSEADAHIPDPVKNVAWKNKFRPNQLPPIEDDILPYGGIVLKEIRCSSPRYREPIHHTIPGAISGSTQIVTEYVAKERNVIRTEPGGGETPDGEPTLIYVCEPVEEDAKNAALARRGWSYRPFYRDDQIVRRGDEARDAAEDNPPMEEGEDIVPPAVISPPKRPPTPKMPPIKA